MTMMEFFHQRINKRKMGNNELGERIDLKGVREVQEEVVKNLTAEEAISTIKKLLVEVKDIKGSNGGTIMYKGATIQNYLTRFFLSMNYIGFQKMQQSPKQIESIIKAGFESEKDSIEDWVSGAVIEAGVIHDILSKNKSTPYPHTIGLNNLVDAMYAIDFFEEFIHPTTGERILNLVQVKKMNDKNKEFTSRSPDVKTDFNRMRDFLDTQELLIPEYLKQNEVSFDENFEEIKDIIEDDEKIKKFYNEKGENYLEKLIQFEYDLVDEIEKQNITIDFPLALIEKRFPPEVVLFFEEKINNSAKELDETPLVFGSVMQGLYYKNYFSKDFDEYVPEENIKLDYFFIWLREWITKKQLEVGELTKKYTALRKKYDKIYGVYHIEPDQVNFKTNPVIITQVL